MARGFTRSSPRRSTRTPPMRSAGRSAPQDKTDLPEGLAGLGEHADVALPVGHGVGGVVLGAELHRAERREAFQQTLADLVDELLDGAAVEVVVAELHRPADDLRRHVSLALT